MGEVIRIDVSKADQMEESQHRDLEMYRKLHSLEVFRIEGRSDEDCELKWLQMITDKDSDTVYYAEPGNDGKQ